MAGESKVALEAQNTQQLPLLATGIRKKQKGEVDVVVIVWFAHQIDATCDCVDEFL